MLRPPARSFVYFLLVMTLRRRLTIVLFALTVSSFGAGLTTYAATWRARATPIDLVIREIRVETSTTVRTDAAEKLVSLVQEQARDGISQKAIWAMADLLSDRDDSVRYWVATALGYAGSQAADAVPALERALREREGVRTLQIVRVGNSNSPLRGFAADMSLRQMIDPTVAVAIASGPITRTAAYTPRRSTAARSPAPRSACRFRSG